MGARTLKQDPGPWVGIGDLEARVDASGGYVDIRLRGEPTTELFVNRLGLERMMQMIDEAPPRPAPLPKPRRR